MGSQKNPASGSLPRRWSRIPAVRKRRSKWVHCCFPWNTRTPAPPSIHNRVGAVGYPAKTLFLPIQVVWAAKTLISPVGKSVNLSADGRNSAEIEVSADVLAEYGHSADWLTEISSVRGLVDGINGWHRKWLWQLEPVASTDALN